MDLYIVSLLRLCHDSFLSRNGIGYPDLPEVARAEV